MNRQVCEQVRDRLPELVAGTLEDEEVRRLGDHLSGCSDCRREESILRALLAARPDPPPELAARIRTRIREELGAPGRAHPSGPALGWRPRRGPIWALPAAALVVLSLGVGILWQGETPEVILEPTEVAVEEPLPESWLWDDGMVAGAPVLEGLTEEELETLLEEMEG